jgi:hypothetical protein
MFKELDVVTLTRDSSEHGLSKGSRGAIVHCYTDGQTFGVEFVAESGETLAKKERHRLEIDSTMQPLP